MMVILTDNRLKQIGLFIILASFFWVGCSSETDDIEPALSGYEMNFVFSKPGEEVIRAKTTFANNDKVFISARVKTVNSGIVDEEVVSSVMKYNGSKWTAYTDDGCTIEKVMMWPQYSVSASFTAYYLPVLAARTPDAPTDITPSVINLSEIREATDDPLRAFRKDIDLNNVIRMQFAHMTTKLAFTGLQKSAGEIYEFGSSSYSICDQIKFTYSAVDGYSHEYVKSTSTTPYTVIQQPEPVFFLHVEDDDVNWKASSKDENIGTFYIKLTQLDRTTTFPASVGFHKMKRGRHYRIYFLSASVNPTLEEDNEWWSNDTPRKFNDATEIQDYFNNLDIAEGITEDLDFNNIPLDGIDLTRSTTGTRGIELNQNLNGNKHTIKNVNTTRGLFNEIPAGITIQDLQIENIRIEATGDPFIEAAGLLAPVNKGTIKDVRIKGSCIIGTNGVRYVGGLVGINEGSISDVQITGSLNIDSYADTTSGTAETPFCVGGLVGYFHGPATNSIINSEIQAACLIRVAGDIPDSDICIGGFAGRVDAGKTIDNCYSTSNILAEGASGANCYSGGFTGMNSGKISRSEAKGNLASGKVSATSTATESRTATGGFIGIVPAATAVINGNSASVKVTETLSGADKAYIGGFCGFSQASFLNCAAYGTISLADAPSGDRSMGKMVGLIDATRNISNSFSATTVEFISGSGVVNFSGNTNTQTNNCHSDGQILNTQGAQITGPTGKATYQLLNNGNKEGYWHWDSSATHYAGMPYLIKE